MLANLSGRQQQPHTEAIHANVVADRRKVLYAFAYQSTNEVLRNSAQPKPAHHDGGAFENVLDGLIRVGDDFIHEKKDFSSENASHHFSVTPCLRGETFLNRCARSNSSSNPRVSRFSRMCASFCSSFSSASPTFFLFVSTTSRHIPYGLAEMRVISRNARPPASRRDTSSPNSSTRDAANPVVSICGKWLIQPQMRSCSATSIVSISAPIFAMQTRNSPIKPSSIFWPEDGATNQVAPWKRSGAAISTPDRSFPAIGCPPRNRWPTLPPNTFAACAMISRLVPPVSVSSASGGSDGPSRQNSSMIAPTGAAH